MKVEVHTNPGSRRPGIERTAAGLLTVRVREPARDGQANTAVIRALAEEYGVPPSKIKLLRGAGARVKLFAIDE